MKLRCIKQNNRQKDIGNLTIGKIYELDEIGEELKIQLSYYVGSYSSLYIKGDDNIHRYYDKECFIDIQQEREEKLKQLGI
jgi:hypothetical protein